MWRLQTLAASRATSVFRVLRLSRLESSGYTIKIDTYNKDTALGVT